MWCCDWGFWGDLIHVQPAPSDVSKLQWNHFKCQAKQTKGSGGTPTLWLTLALGDGGALAVPDEAAPMGVCDHRFLLATGWWGSLVQCSHSSLSPRTQKGVP